jgi:hypothetical protein
MQDTSTMHDTPYLISQIQGKKSCRLLPSLVEHTPDISVMQVRAVQGVRLAWDCDKGTILPV